MVLVINKKDYSRKVYAFFTKNNFTKLNNDPTAKLYKVIQDNFNQSKHLIKTRIKCFLNNQTQSIA